MQPSVQSGIVGTTQSEARRIAALVDDLARIVQLLDSDIAVEESRAGVSDRADRSYPMLARHLAARRYNLEATIEALQRHLAVLNRGSAYV